MSRFFLGPGAAADFDDIWEYIAADNADAADLWMERFVGAFRLLAENPGIGHVRADLTARPCRFWPVDNYLIIYRVRPNEVEIVAVTHGGRDIPRLLSGRTP